MSLQPQNYNAMNLSQIANRYRVSVYIVKKWLATFAPELSRPDGCYVYTPDQVRIIVEACGEFPES
jgi:transposase